MILDTARVRLSNKSFLCICVSLHGASVAQSDERGIAEGPLRYPKAFGSFFSGLDRKYREPHGSFENLQRNASFDVHRVKHENKNTIQKFH